MLEEIISVTADRLVGETARIKVEGYRFVTMSCVETGENEIEILYHFDKDLKLIHFLLRVSKDTPVPSISPVWFSAFLVENEIQDLFGIRFAGLVLDYEG
ncbi:MAG: NADH-quinone oxidoreductase subunit C, partial [Desulfobacterales bacterium]